MLDIVSATFFDMIYISRYSDYKQKEKKGGKKKKTQSIDFVILN